MVDLTPGYRELAPPPELRDVVACLWVRVHGTGDDVRVVPDACSDVVWQQGTGTTVVGPDTGAKLVAGVPGDILIGMRLRPGAGGGALGVPLDALRDLRVEAAEVDRAFDIAGDLAPADVIGRFLEAVAGRRRDELVAEAARRLSRRDVRTVARELSISDRQLRRRFPHRGRLRAQTLAARPALPALPSTRSNDEARRPRQRSRSTSATPTRRA